MFFDLLAKNYSKLFPLDAELFEFIKSYCPTAPHFTILDVGCASGDLALALSKQGYDVTGIDVSAAMIHIAEEKAKKLNLNTSFKTLHMLDINELGSFDMITCFGNTLPHLENERKVSAFFRAVYNGLSAGGFFIFELLNYDKILKEKVVDLKRIETDKYVLVRTYEFFDTNRIGFRISFSDLVLNESYTLSEPLFPIRQAALRYLLENSGFSKINVYSDYEKHESNLGEFSTIYVVEK